MINPFSSGSESLFVATFCLYLANKIPSQINMFVNWVNYFHFNHIPFNIDIMVWDTHISIKTNPCEFIFLYENLTSCLDF